MSEYIRADKQILVAVIGLTTSLLTGIILGLIEVETGFAIYSWMFWFIIPVGAVLAGFAVASGYYAGAMLFHQKPVGGVLFNMIAASVSAFLIVKYVPYYTLEVEGVQVKELVSFWQYLDISIRNTSLSLVRGSASTGELGGFWGYAYTGLQLLGFSFGGICVFSWLSRNPYCEKCSRYLKKSGQQDRFMSDGEDLITKMQDFVGLIENNQFNDAIRLQADNMGVKSNSSHHLRTRLIAKICTSCGINHLDFIASKLDGNDWKDIDETEIRMFTDIKLDTAGD